MTENDFHRFVRNEVALGQLVAMFGTPGRLVPKRLAEEQYREENEQILTEAVFIQSTNFLSKVEIKTNEFLQYWTNRQSQYWLPEKLVASYVEFPASNYLASADQRLAKDKDFEAKLDAAFLRRSTNDFLDATGKPLPTAEAKAKFREEIRMDTALAEARNNASRFAEDLSDMTPAKPENLAKVAAMDKWKLPVKESEPFSQADGPKDLPTEFTRAFSLNETNIFVNPPIASREQKAAYVVSVKQRIPGKPRTLDEVREEFTKEYKEYESRQLARKAANALHGKLSAELAKGKSFKEIVEAEGFKVTEVPAFARRAQSIPALGDQVSPSQYAAAAFDTAPGKVSNFRDTSEGGFIVHTKSKAPADPARAAAELPEYIERNRNRWENMAFNEWFRRELELAKPALTK